MEGSGNRIFGKSYELIKELGRGGMGTVYLANDIKLHRNVAIKVLNLPNEISSQEKDKLVYSFNREAIAIANLNHRNIVNIYYIDQEDDLTNYIVMELIEGQPISQLIRIKTLSPQVILGITLQICDALDYIHQNGVIHRDIKPENLMYSGKGHAKLTDFGIAKFQNDSKEVQLTSAGTIVGTILYMSPEQLQDPESVEGSSDIYSYSASMYEMLTGKTPFYGDNARDVIMKIISEEAIPPSKVKEGISKEFDDIIMQGLAKDPGKRFNNMSQFIKALKSTRLFNELMEKSAPNLGQEIAKYYEERGLDPRESLPPTLIKKVYEIPKANLDWLDKLDSLMDIAEQKSNNENIFMESMDCIIPHIKNPQIKNLLEFLKKVPNASDLLMLLTNITSNSIFQFVKRMSGSDVLEKLVLFSNMGFIDTKTGDLIKLLNYTPSLPPDFVSLISVLKKSLTPDEMIKFLCYFDGKKTMKQIVEEHYAEEKIDFFFNFITDFDDQNVVSYKLNDKANELKSKFDILLGDVLVTLSYITRPQLELALKEQKLYTVSKPQLGEILIDLGFIPKSKLESSLKLQGWYKKTFKM